MTVKELENVGIIRQIMVEKRANEHSVCQVCLLITEEEKLADLKRKLGRDACVEDDTRIYMRGTVREISCTKTFSGSEAVVKIVSFSDKADTVRKNRVFQSTKKKYRDIMEALHTDEYSFQITESTLAGLEEERIILQDDVTDFAFARSVAQSRGCALFVNDTDHKCAVSIGTNIGMAGRDIAEENTILYDFTINGAGERIGIKARDFLELGQVTAYEGKTYTVMSVYIDYKNGSQVFSYALERKEQKESAENYVSTWLGKARVLSNADPDYMGRIQVSFLEYEDMDKENQMWIPYMPCLTEKGQGMVLIPGTEEIVNIFCNNGRCYADGCVRETAMDDKIKNVENRTVMFGDKYVSFTEEKAELEIFSCRMTIEEDAVTLSHEENMIKLEKDKVTIKSGDAKFNLNDNTIQLLANGKVDIKADKINARTSSFDIG